MKKIIYPFFLIIISLLFFYQFFIRGLMPISADDIVGLYNPFRDLYGANYPNGIPFKNPLITDPVRQQYPWKKLAIEAEKKLEIPLWNPYSMAGTPLLANFQSSPFYPLNILLIIFPFNIGWTLLIISQVVFAGIFMFMYLKNQKLQDESSLLGSIAFSFSGFSIAWLEWGTVVATGLWVPLVLLSLDKLFSGNRKWIFGLIIALSSSFLAGHLQIFFYSLILYFLYTVFLLIKSKNTVSNILFISMGFIASLIIAIPALLPTLQFISLSARSVDLNWHVVGWFIPPIHLIQFIVPDFFGNPSTLNYFGAWNYGEMIGYVGIAPLILAFLALFSKRSKVLFFWLVALFSLVLALGTPLAQIPYVFNIPFFSTAQPTRLIFLIDASLSICAAFGLEYLIKNKSKKHVISIISFFAIFFGIIGALVFIGPKFLSGTENLAVSKRNLYFPGFIFIVTSVILIIYCFSKEFKLKKILIPALILITILDLFRFGWKFTPFTNHDYIFPSTKIISYLKDQPNQNFRLMSLDSQILPPNFSVVYKLQDVSGYDPLYLLTYGEFISAMERNKADIDPPFGFSRLVTPHNYSSRLFPLLNVKYLLTFSKLPKEDFSLIMNEGKTNLYENKKLMPRVFFVSSTINSVSKNDSIQKLYDENMDLSKSAVVQQFKSSEFSLGKTQIIKYSENKVDIETQNAGEGFLVLLDSYYPTWSVTIDGMKSEIHVTDYNFRGVVIPAGKHKIQFKNNLL